MTSFGSTSVGQTKGFGPASFSPAKGFGPEHAAPQRLRPERLGTRQELRLAAPLHHLGFRLQVGRTRSELKGSGARLALRKYRTGPDFNELRLV